MAAGRGAVVGDFALDPDIAKLPLDQREDLGDQLMDRPDAARRGRLLEEEIELGRGWVGLRHWDEFNWFVWRRVGLRYRRDLNRPLSEALDPKY